MKILKTLMWASLGTAILGAVGCDRSDNAPPPPPPPPPQAEAQGPLPPPVPDAAPEVAPETDIIVPQAPPPPQVEVVPAAPSPDYVWVGGYWNWNNSRYVWIPGGYNRPPAPGRVWVAPHYYNDARGYHYTAGAWRARDDHAPDPNHH